MSVAANVISAVIKSIIGDKVGDGLAKELADISADAISEKGINEITDFIEKEKAKIDHILSRDNLLSLSVSENHIDYVVVEIKDLFSGIQITDEVFRECRYDSMDLSAFLWNEYKKFKNDYIECESEIKLCLFAVADALIKLVRESEDFEKGFLIQISNSVDDANVGLQKVSEYLEDNFSKIDDNSQILINILLTILEQIQKMNMQHYVTKSSTDETKKFQNNKKQKYIENWNSRLFLHIDNDERPITLADAFIMPDFDAYFYHQEIVDEKIEQTLERFLNAKKTSVLLIAGVPGIGKTSIISWFANQYKENCGVIILRFRDWDYDDFGNGLLKAICNTLYCNRKDLNDKILVLDGFDEIKSLDRRNYILSGFINDLKDLEGSKIIITSRLSYIDMAYFNESIVLRPFNIKKIKEFYTNITGKTLNEKDIDTKNLDVLGVPVILYMAIMSDIDITKGATKSELYNRVFAEKQGIFDKFSEYDSGAQIMRNPDNAVCYLKFLREIAFKMFEKDKLVLLRNECDIPKLLFQGKKVSVLEFPIKHLFENALTNVEFIHKSIYEYFASEYIYTLIEDVLLKESENIERELAGVLGNMLSSRRLSDEILEFLKFKIRNGSLRDKFNMVNETFQIMLKDGMTYYTNKCYKNILLIEMNVFANMLELIHLWDEYKYLRFDNLFFDYLIYNKYVGLNLKGIVFKLSNNEFKNDLLDLIKTVSLKRANLQGANLEGADLQRADLQSANFEEANLREADFQFAKLRYANISKANLMGANLVGADFRGADLTDTDLTDAMLDGSKWDMVDVRNAFHQLKTAKFQYIIVEDYEERMCSKKRLFQNKGEIYFD